MSFLTGTERAQSIWGRLLLTVMFAAYIAASIKHVSPEPLVVGFGLLIAVSIVYYIPLRFIYWLRKGDGEITNKFLLWLPFPILTAFGVVMIFMSEIP